MALPVYPTLKGLAYPIGWTPRFYNMKTQTTASGADIDLSLAQYPLHDFELQYEFLRQGGFTPAPPSDELKTLMGFILQMGGNVGRFLFSNPVDNSVTGQNIGTGDGSTTVFTLVRTFGAGGFSGTEPVGYVNNSGLNVYLNGVLQASGYTLSRTTPCLQTITFSVAPAAAVAVTVDMSYWYYCKFPADAQDFKGFMNQLWMTEKVPFHSCRPGA